MLLHTWLFGIPISFVVFISLFMIERVVGGSRDPEQQPSFGSIVAASFLWPAIVAAVATYIISWAWRKGRGVR